LFLFLASTIGDLLSLIEYTDYFDQFKKYRLNLFSSIQKRLGWNAQDNENPLVAMLRPMVLNIMGKSGDQAIIDEAKKRFQQHIEGNLIDPNIRGAVYAIVSRYGDENTQEELRKLYKAAEMTEEKVRLLRSMGQSNNPDIIQKTLDFIFESVCEMIETIFIDRNFSFRIMFVCKIPRPVLSVVQQVELVEI
jgi:puromycin-sensitive aminopeptidase